MKFLVLGVLLAVSGIWSIVVGDHHSPIGLIVLWLIILSTPDHTAKLKEQQDQIDSLQQSVEEMTDPITNTPNKNRTMWGG